MKNKGLQKKDAGESVFFYFVPQGGFEPKSLSPFYKNGAYTRIRICGMFQYLFFNV